MIGQFMRRLVEIGVVAAVIAVGGLSAGRLGFQDAPPVPFSPDEFYIVPVRVHLLRLKDSAGVGTKLTKSDMQRIYRKANGIWHAAGIHLWIESIVEESPAGRKDSDSRPIESFRQLVELRPKDTSPGGMMHIYYVGRMPVNGLYVYHDALFVQEAASLTVVPGGIDEPLPRVTAHEIGHGLKLAHRQSRTNLMASGTTGTILNDEEIQTVRKTAESLDWIQRASKFLESAETLFSNNKKEESASRCQAILDLPGASPLKDRAAHQLTRAL